jgi:hypothetical protein
MAQERPHQPRDAVLMARSCRAPRSVSVSGHWRNVGPRRKRRRTRTGPRAGTTYWVAESSTGGVCGHHHRDALAALRCVGRQGKRERIARARLTRRQARQRKRYWYVAKRVAT